MTIDWLPSAVRVPHGRSLAWASGTPIWRGLLHTTESAGWPDYENWEILPHATIMPTANQGVLIHQHLPFSQASFSLVNAPGGTETNREWAFQFELVGTCDSSGPGYYWPTADDTVLADLYEQLIHPLSQAFGIEEAALNFQGYPASYGSRGKTNTVRLSGSDWARYNGWLGHQHVPENVHGDPGGFPFQKMMETQMLSADDKKWISGEIASQLANLPGTTADAVWADDVIPDTQDPANTTWRAGNSLGRAKNILHDTVAPQVAAILALLTPTVPTPPVTTSDTLDDPDA